MELLFLLYFFTGRRLTVLQSWSQWGVVKRMTTCFEKSRVIC
ncbi:unnamed protein product [Ixodes pacificus]